MAQPDPSTISRDLNLLYPGFATKVNKALAKCNALGHQIEVFEGWRSPQRQDYLFEQGRTRPGAIVTKARGWESWHQYSVACDIAKRVAGKWSWDFDTKAVSTHFLAEGLEWLNPYEQCHFQWTKGLRLDQAKTLTQSAGVQRLWQEIGKE